MSLSRRKFTKDLKLAAVQQLEAGSSAAEVARAFEVNPNLLHRWRKVDLSPKLRQTVKSGISANGEFYLCRCLEGSSRKT